MNLENKFAKNAIELLRKDAKHHERYIQNEKTSHVFRFV